MFSFLGLINFSNRFLIDGDLLVELQMTGIVQKVCENMIINSFQKTFLDSNAFLLMRVNKY